MKTRNLIYLLLLGCLFEAFLGAMFLDFNKLSVKDEDGWFQNIFLTGPGFQMVQIFLENVFEITNPNEFLRSMDAIQKRLLDESKVSTITL